ncbi:hypothetical protein VL20_2744 [Microcystis panniformis FACHB-1757]|uniref:Uncharacterized protein n=1 Tax=Microcystis panniformis FACHB-1757 TaxID=1638788 RepID=A0A0K1S1B3_9CHRO|nr:hypothetical protein VL20_2744 [Microcystis panniformis FACHB-1757]
MDVNIAVSQFDPPQSSLEKGTFLVFPPFLRGARGRVDS